MITHGIVYSAVKPEPIEVLETKVFLSYGAHTVDRETEEGIVQEWEYLLQEYEKDEYIQFMADRNEELEAQLVDTQLALVDVYEMILEG